MLKHNMKKGSLSLVYLVQYFPPEKASGSDLVEDLLEGFAKHGWDIKLYTPTPTRGVTKDQRAEYAKKRIEKKYDGKLTIHRMHLYREGKGFVPRAIRYLLFSIECFWKAVTVPADFIFTGSGPPSQGVIVGLAKKFSRKKKVIYNLQDIFPDSLITSGICSKKSILFKIGKKMENFTYRNADLIITISEDMKRNIIEKGVEQRKVKVVRNWIDTEVIKPVSRNQNKLFHELNLDVNKFYVLYSGNIGYTMGLEYILEAAELIRHKNGEIFFLFFGDGSEREKLINIRDSRKLDNVFFYPFQERSRISEVYGIADISVISGRPGLKSVSMPSKTWTIMASGVGILAIFEEGSEVVQLIQDADCGISAHPGDPKNIADAILKLYADRNITKQYGINARKYAEAYVSKNKAVQSYIDAIEKVSTSKQE